MRGRARPRDVTHRPACRRSLALAREPDKAWSGAQDVAIYALGLIGVNYKFGGNSPESGLDCSGLVRHVFQEVTGVTLPRTSKEMSALGAQGRAQATCSRATSSSSTRAASRSRTSASISATTASSTRRRAAARSRSRRCRRRIGRSASTARAACSACCRRLAPGVVPLTVAGQLAPDMTWAKPPALGPADATP